MGEEESRLHSLVRVYGLESKIHFLGYRTDVKQLLSMCDLFVLPSIREGLPRSLMEAMAAGLPCIVSDIRGNRDLIADKKYRCSLRSVDDWITVLNNMCKLSAVDLHEIGNNNRQRLFVYDFDNVVGELKNIYQSI